METAFPFEVNDNGTWRLALLVDSHDEHNKSFQFVGEGGMLVPTDGFIPRGTDSGHFRDRS